MDESKRGKMKIPGFLPLSKVQEQQDYVENLSMVDKDLVIKYTRSGSNVNNGLRKAEDPNTLPSGWKLLTHIIYESPALKEDITVFRGVYPDEDFKESLEVGKDFVDKGFTSTSRSVISARNFMTHGQKVCCLLVINIPAGSHILALEKIGLSSEFEILLPPNVKMYFREEGDVVVKVHNRTKVPVPTKIHAYVVDAEIPSRPPRINIKKLYNEFREFKIEEMETEIRRSVTISDFNVEHWIEGYKNNSLYLYELLRNVGVEKIEEIRKDEEIKRRKLIVENIDKLPPEIGKVRIARRRVLQDFFEELKKIVPTSSLVSIIFMDNIISFRGMEKEVLIQLYDKFFDPDKYTWMYKYNEFSKVFEIITDRRLGFYNFSTEKTEELWG